MVIVTKVISCTSNSLHCAYVNEACVDVIRALNTGQLRKLDTGLVIWRQRIQDDLQILSKKNQGRKAIKSAR